jgi:hypothetical protein
MIHKYENLTPAQIELKEEFEELLKGSKWWTPETLQKLAPHKFKADTIRRCWMKVGVPVNGKKIKLKYWLIGRFYLIKSEWIIDFFLRLNPHLGEKNET